MSQDFNGGHIMSIIMLLWVEIEIILCYESHLIKVYIFFVYYIKKNSMVNL